MLEEQKKPNQQEMEQAVRTLLVGMGENPERADLKDTPKRFVKALMSFSPQKDEPEVTLFKSNSSGVVVVKNLEVRSMCGHHLFPFIGTCSIGYVPFEYKAGLSKFQRVLDHFAEKPQDQENLTKQMLDFLVKKINPRAMVITITCKHTCMSGRGVKCHDAETTTLEEFVADGDEAFLQKIYTQI